jgi:hypothetical protein
MEQADAGALLSSILNPPFFSSRLSALRVSAVN